MTNPDFKNNIASTDMVFKLPLEVIFEPKEDITVFELALCLQYHGRQLYHYESIDTRVERHFKIIDHNKSKI